jgi:RNA polymerase sigma factor (sigma-70 family)
VFFLRVENAHCAKYSRARLSVTFFRLERFCSEISKDNYYKGRTMQQSSYRPTSPPDKAAIEQWYQRHATSLLAYVRQHVPSQEDAEDIVVEAFIAALEHKDSSLFSGTEQEQLAWLRRVAYHKCIDQHRRSVRRPTVLVEAASERLFADERLDPEQHALRYEEGALLSARLSQLPEHYQTILRLRFANGLRCTEIGRLLNKNEGTVRVLLSRALNRLRGVYTRQQEKDSDEAR